ncbi:MAG TPA: 16S rRNA (cytidine(1402)-2'-O)-methyltransferase [Elusimicrobiales bacterium]|nr:16S rRNA (cytidine(1402)-2'-O)-methyltransferase [Elusimicrobiales bacterium]
MLFIVPTPIGNLQDITRRAVETLGLVDFILCEDTRKTRKLLNHLGIKTSLIRYNEHNQKSVDSVLELLKNGKKLALVSDGGTPCVSDPGYKIVSKASESGIKIVSLAGASAVTCALAGSGFGGGSFVFLGFLPRTETKIIKSVKNALELKKPVIIFESPHRIVKLLKIISENFPADLQVTVARELTKVYEEWIKGTIGKVYDELSLRPKIKGEIVVVLNLTGKQKGKENSSPLASYNSPLSKGGRGDLKKQ